MLRRIVALYQIVILYMAYTYNLPTWCKVLLGIAITINAITFAYRTYKAVEEARL